MLLLFWFYSLTLIWIKGQDISFKGVFISILGEQCRTLSPCYTYSSNFRKTWQDNEPDYTDNATKEFLRAKESVIYLKSHLTSVQLIICFVP